MSIKRLFSHSVAAAIILLLLPIFSISAQDETARDPVSLAARLLGFEGYAIPDITPVYRPGETESFWVTRTTDDLPVRIEATLAAVTPNVYLWVEAGIPFQRGNMQQMAGQLSLLVYTLRRRDLYGDPTFFPGLGEVTDPNDVLPIPDVDDDPHLYVLYAANLRDELRAIYNPNHSLPTELAPGGYSNEHEMIMLNTTQFPNVPLHDGQYAAAAARAFYRMVADYNYPGQAAWLKEAVAWFTLRQLQEQPLSAQDVAAYFDAPNTPLNRTPQALTAAATLAGQQLFLNYTAQRFGAQVLQDIVTQPGEGMSAIDAVLAQHQINDLVTGAPVTSRDLFADFVMANALNLRIGDGRFVHTLTELEEQQIASGVLLEDQFEVDLPQQTVSQFGARYLWLTSSTPRTFAVVFNGQPSVSRLSFQPDSDPNNHFYWSGRGQDQDTTLTRAFDLSGVSSATLTFDTWYSLAHHWNYAYVEASTDGGKTWDILPTEMSSAVNPYGAAYGPGFTGVSNLEGPRPFPYLGVVLDTNGVTVMDIAPDGPLAETGIQAGDSIIGYDGQPWPGNRPNLIGYLANFEPGDTVNLYVERGEERFDLPVVLGAHPTRVFTPEPRWITQQADLSAYAGRQIMLRFEYISLPDRENEGIAVDNIAIPEIGFQDDAESGIPGWTLNGWQQMDNQAPQRFLLQVATTPTNFSPGSVRRLIGPSDTTTSGTWTFNINPGEGFLIAISGLNDNTDSPAVFDLFIRDLTPPEATGEPEATETPATPA